MNKTLTWLLIIASFAWFVYISSSVLMPFITSLVLAYFFSPVANFIEKKSSLNRGVIAIVIVSIVCVLFLSLWAMLIPIIYEQIASFINYLPKHRIYFEKHVVAKVFSYFGAEYQEKFKHIMDQIFTGFSRSIVSFIDHMWKSGLVFVNLVIMLVLVPMITFYLIKDWKILTQTLDDLVPMCNKNSFHKLIADINHAVAGFIRGQLNVCLLLALYYAVALSVIDLNFGILIGITTGIVSFVPFLGLLGGFVAASIVSLFQFQSWEGFFMVAIVFIIGNILESLVTPKLIGRSTGVNPIWVVFFVLLGGSLYGIVGMFIAVPLGASLAVIVRFAVKKYYESSLYKCNF